MAIEDPSGETRVTFDFLSQSSVGGIQHHLVASQFSSTKSILLFQWKVNSVQNVSEEPIKS